MQYFVSEDELQTGLSHYRIPSRELLEQQLESCRELLQVRGPCPHSCCCREYPRSFFGPLLGVSLSLTHSLSLSLSLSLYLSLSVCLSLSLSPSLSLSLLVSLSFGVLSILASPSFGLSLYRLISSSLARSLDRSLSASFVC